jgi:hypothetical protein
VRSIRKGQAPRARARRPLRLVAWIQDIKGLSDLADRPSALENKDLRFQIAVQRSSVNHVDLYQLLKVTAPIKLEPVLPPESPGPNLSPHPPNPQRLGPLFPKLIVARVGHRFGSQRKW